jgi:hypothetical protein
MERENLHGDAKGKRRMLNHISAICEDELSEKREAAVTLRDTDKLGEE